MMQKDHTFYVQDCTQSEFKRECAISPSAVERQGILEGSKPRRDRRQPEGLSRFSKREQLKLMIIITFYAYRLQPSRPRSDESPLLCIALVDHERTATFTAPKVEQIDAKIQANYRVRDCALNRAARQARFRTQPFCLVREQTTISDRLADSAIIRFGS